MTGLIGLCAICANDGEGAMQTLDRREVFVCDRCENEHPIHGGYDASGVGKPSVHGLTFGGQVGCRRAKGRTSGGSGNPNEGRY